MFSVNWDFFMVKYKCICRFVNFFKFVWWVDWFLFGLGVMFLLKYLGLCVKEMLVFLFGEWLVFCCKGLIGCMVLFMMRYEYKIFGVWCFL